MDWARLMAERRTGRLDIPDFEWMDHTLRTGSSWFEPLDSIPSGQPEHYGSAYSDAARSPLQYLALLSHWGHRPRGCRTAVIVAALVEYPLSVPHEVAMLDILLRGRRLHLGIGRGIAQHEYASLGYAMKDLTAISTTLLMSYGRPIDTAIQL